MAELYAKTCFIDADDKLCGVLKLKDGCFVDFDRRYILCNNEEIHLSNPMFRILCKLIRNGSNVVEYDALFTTYYGEGGTPAECNIKTIRNCISTLRKYADIRNRAGDGYYFKHTLLIRRFHNVRGEDVENIASLFSDDAEQADDQSPLAFSAKFFHAGARALQDADDWLFWKQADRLSNVFRPQAELCSAEEQQPICPENLLRGLCDLVLEHCTDQTPQHLLKISGPLGAYKNRLMQYLFLALCRNGKHLLPVYMDLAYYDDAVGDGGDTSDIPQELEKDFATIRMFVEGQPHRTPVILLDGVHEYQYNKEVSYNAVSEELERFPCKLIVCEDTDFTVNSENLFSVHPLAPHDFLYTLWISSVNLTHRKSSVAFIRSCLDLFELPVPYSADRIYDVLMRLNVMQLDAYWLRFLLTSAGFGLFDPRQTIYSLYHSICLRYLDDPKQEAAAAELAFRYEIEPSSITDPGVFRSDLWKLMTKHRSVKDYLIARHYVRRIARINYNNKDQDAVMRELSFFNMVLPKDITRFVVPMIAGVDDYEHKIMIIAERYYHKLSVLGKSELTFWMARLTNRTRKDKCKRLLRAFAKEEIARYRENAFDTEADRKDSAFLIRGIQVSLIYENDADALEAYLDSLIFDKTANEINRGFHLEYYGDKPFVPYNTLLDYEDEITKGENTFNVLCLALDKVTRKERSVAYSALLDLMTLCNLIQARIEAPTADTALDVTPYVDKCIGYLEYILGNRILRNVQEKTPRSQRGMPRPLPNVAKYFRWMYRSLKELQHAAQEQPDQRLRYYRAAPYNKFSQAYTVARTGWVRQGVEKPENIMEHMYSCFLIAMMYLPEKTGDPLYNKSAIMQTLLIHDLGETETGDIDRNDKLRDPDRYDREENRVMQDFLFSGSYPHAVDLGGYYQGWADWEKKSGINYAVAKDIDDLQTIYRFCRYYVQNPDLFQWDDILHWLRGLDTLQTEVVQEIADFLVINNPLFASLMQRYDRGTEG